MNIVHINYTPGLATKEKSVSFREVTRFVESYTPKAKDLTIQLECIEEAPIEDTALAELIGARIHSIVLVAQNEDGENETLAQLTDYPSTRDIRKEYNVKSCAVNLTCTFQRVLLEENV